MILKVIRSGTSNQCIVFMIADDSLVITNIMHPLNCAKILCCLVWDCVAGAGTFLWSWPFSAGAGPPFSAGAGPSQPVLVHLCRCWTISSGAGPSLQELAHLCGYWPISVGAAWFISAGALYSDVSGFAARTAFLGQVSLEDASYIPTFLHRPTHIHHWAARTTWGEEIRLHGHLLTSDELGQNRMSHCILSYPIYKNSGGWPWDSTKHITGAGVSIPRTCIHEYHRCSTQYSRPFPRCRNRRKFPACSSPGELLL